jgi:hypothetical protein
VKVLSRFRGAMAVQRLAHLTGTIQLKSIDFLGIPLYNHAQSGWLLLGGVIFSRPHNPSVPGSIPGCPTLSLCLHNTVTISLCSFPTLLLQQNEALCQSFCQDSISFMKKKGGIDFS